jgi:hypothetical protein
MEVSGQLHVTASLTSKEEHPLVLSGIEIRFLGRPTRSLFPRQNEVFEQVGAKIILKYSLTEIKCMRAE